MVSSDADATKEPTSQPLETHGSDTTVQLHGVIFSCTIEAVSDNCTLSLTVSLSLVV